MSPALNSHINNFNNPHQVTAEQVDAPTNQEFSNHVNDKTNPHDVTAIQVGALPTSGGTVNGAVTINGNLNLGNGEVIINDGTMNIQAGTSINFQTPTLTQNGQQIGGGSVITNIIYVTSALNDIITLGPYEKIPKLIVLYPSGFDAFSYDYGSGTKGYLNCAGIYSIPSNIGGSCTGAYTAVNPSDNSVYSGAGTGMGTLQGSVGNYTIVLNKNTDFLTKNVFPPNFKYFISCAYFD